MKRIFKHTIFLIGLYACNASAEGFAPFADFLVWHASQETSSTWVSVVSIPNNKTIDFNAANVDFGWNVGFRGGFIYEANQNYWDSQVYWTYFRTKTNNNIALAEQLLIPEFFSGFLSLNKFFAADLNWKLVMNMFDYDLSHEFNVSKDLTLRPAIGLKLGTINQSINCAWNALAYQSSENLTNNFFGIGPTLGISTKFNLYKNFSMVGDFSTAFMWGNWNIKDVYTRPASLFSTQTTITTSLSKSLLGTLMCKYCLGLEWIHQGRSNLSLLIGYEMQFWANQLRLPTFQQLPLHGDLTLQGGTCRICIEL